MITINNIGKDQDKFLDSMNPPIWCNEKNLETYLSVLFPNSNILVRKYLKLDSKKTFPDFIIEDKKVIVEFDGYRHFTDPLIIYNDCIKNNLFLTHGFSIIRIPYFVQLTESVVSFLFQQNFDFSNNFPHGFIHPASGSLGHFCKLGLSRAEHIINSYPSEVKEQIFLSLQKRSEYLDCPVTILNPLLEN